MQGKSLLPTFEERNDSKGQHARKDYGTELSDNPSNTRGTEDGDDFPPARHHTVQVPSFGVGFQPPDTPQSSKSAKSRVFRVTTLDTSEEWDGIPHQRLKTVLMGGSGGMRRCLLWILVLLACVGIFFVSSYMHASGNLQKAIVLSNQLSSLGTSSNDVVAWIAAEAKAKSAPSRPYPTMSHHSNSGKPMVSDGVMDQADALLKKSKGKSDGRKLGRGPAMVDKIKSIRLPVGLAVTLSIQRMAERREGDNDLTSGHDERYQDLVKLRDKLPLDLYQKSGQKRIKVDIERLLRLAADSRLKTDIPIGGGISSWGPNPSQDMYSEDKRLFVKQLQKFVLCTQKGAQVPCSTYKDIMRYEKTSRLLYWGRFRLLQFDGPGVLFWPNGGVAYNGTWSKGRMHGEGELLDRSGVRVWKGKFKSGVPLSSWATMVSNYGSWW